MESKEKFLLFYNKIQREGADKLLNYIKSTDFFEAPASTKYHGSHEGGLCEHSVNVCQRLLRQDTGYTEETLCIVSLLHDLCKANLYGIDFKNVKQPNGTWQRVPYYIIEDRLPIGNHGEKSVFIIQRYMDLSASEIAAIRYHMGAFQEGDVRNWGKAAETYPLVAHLHIADIQATYFDESRK